MPTIAPAANSPQSEIKTLLRSGRDKFGHDQKDVAREIGYEPTYVGMMENGVRVPSLRYCLAFAKRYLDEEQVAQLLDLRQACVQRKLSRRQLELARNSLPSLRGELGAHTDFDLAAELSKRYLGGEENAGNVLAMLTIMRKASEKHEVLNSGAKSTVH